MGNRDDGAVSRPGGGLRPALNRPRQGGARRTDTGGYGGRAGAVVDGVGQRDGGRRGAGRRHVAAFIRGSAARGQIRHRAAVGAVATGHHRAAGTAVHPIPESIGPLPLPLHGVASAKLGFGREAPRRAVVVDEPQRRPRVHTHRTDRRGVVVLVAAVVVGVAAQRDGYVAALAKDMGDRASRVGAVLYMPAVGVDIAAAGAEQRLVALAQRPRAVERKAFSNAAPDLYADGVFHRAAAHRAPHQHIEIRLRRGQVVHGQHRTAAQMAALHRGAVLHGRLYLPFVEHPVGALVGHHSRAPVDDGAWADENGLLNHYRLQHQRLHRVHRIALRPAAQAAVVVVDLHIAHHGAIADCHLVAGIAVGRGRGADGIPHQAVGRRGRRAPQHQPLPGARHMAVIWVEVGQRGRRNILADAGVALLCRCLQHSKKHRHGQQGLSTETNCHNYTHIQVLCGVISCL